ncbi:MAG TPA: hypothetical protein DDX47_02635 [Candidatus Jacksonbacteria bacterium]|nr:MAG: hypothetical protein A2240_06185 [Candidatus Jacksonbacteria bacterium RIFOXYA2_FULL_43_12]OGY81078.1 MAG: hypothetical protein A2550_02595 [Candidatus Jacksonbacteria bacterium RIFOXYD2_FULL_43_21]HBH46238.1 hypothetical protein [Candidatus Jacksonbacteria bacterium]HCC50371.1 hypothetical protein [Candidatus Jacksonbacteria bacterium]HCE49103.1 hypothetical protein [Candidatus Jacksonbacteria bacterium]
MIIYLVGNSLIDADAMPFKIKPFLQKQFPKIDFLEFDPTENLPDDQSLIFIDTVINLKKTQLFSTIDEFVAVRTKNLSLHDFDLYAELALRKKIGLNEKYLIIGVPKNGEAQKIAWQVKNHLLNFYPVLTGDKIAS